MNKERPWHTRGYLPHFEAGEQPQFITLRLGDSLPQSVLEKWQRELEGEKDADATVRDRIEGYLDQGYGKCYLRKPEIATVVQDALLFGDGKKYRLLSWVIMPNHIHVLFVPIFPHSLSELMHSLKSFTSHEANKLLKRSGRFWQREYFDRCIRDEEHYRNTFIYILMNPVKAKLCKDPRDWEFSSAHYWKKAG